MPFSAKKRSIPQRRSLRPTNKTPDAGRGRLALAASCHLIAANWWQVDLGQSCGIVEMLSFSTYFPAALPRIIVSSEPTVYHVITRVSRGEFLFGDLEKERMRKMIWQMADFCGVEVLTYAVMSNHLGGQSSHGNNCP